MSDTTGWENIIDHMLRRDVEPLPLNFSHLLLAYEQLGALLPPVDQFGTNPENWA